MLKPQQQNILLLFKLNILYGGNKSNNTSCGSILY